MNNVFAIFLRFPFDKEIICINSKKPNILCSKMPSIDASETLVCVNYDIHISSLKSYKDISNLFDMNDAVKLLTGIPIKYYAPQDIPWRSINCLKNNNKGNNNNKYFKLFSEIEEGKYDKVSGISAHMPADFCRKLLEILKIRYDQIVLDLKKNNLYNLFCNVEMRLKLLFGKNGIEGINYDKEKLNSLLIEMDKEYYKAIYYLEIEKKWHVPSFIGKVNYSDIKEYIPEYDSTEFSNKYFWDQVELYKDQSKFLNCLYSVYYLQRDIAELLKIKSMRSGKCRLTYDIVGTVSGRISIISPGVQYMKKKSRCIFVPQNDHVFIYADYCQFEPGIIACLTNDPDIIAMYNTGDIYEKMSKALKGKDTRKIAKTIFLSFLYGMKEDTLKIQIGKKYSKEIVEEVINYLQKFKTINDWKKRSILESKKNGFFRVGDGYFRMIKPNDNELEVARWGPNHLIQSYASRIFKNALLKISREIPQTRMLIPMHDAILVECPVSVEKECRKKIIKIMENSFTEFCPMLKPRVKIEKFCS